MNIIYYSMTGNVKSFINKSDYFNQAINMEEINYKITQPYILITSTINFGDVPQKVKDFLSYSDNSHYIKGVISSGNKNWGPNFGRAGDIISEKYNIPLLMKFEMRGNKESIDRFNNIMRREMIKK